MSEGLYANPDSIKDFPSGKKKESIVDIYVSAESLRVYDNPWVENTSPNTPGPTGAQQTVTEKTRKRNHVRSCSMSLGLLCLLLLVGIICIGVKMNNNKNNCDSQRPKLLEDESNLIKRNHELAANNTKLGKEIDRLRNSYCVEPRKKQECNDVPQKKSL